MIDNIDYNPSNAFYSPFNGSVLLKAEEENGKWIIYVQASNEGLDQDDEVILSKALKDARDYYLEHGVISWDHKHKQLHDPSFIIGEPLDVAFTKSNETLVKGWLYQKNNIAKKVWNNIESGAKRLGASVGGGILAKSKNQIGKIVWDETALTHKPVNDKTLGNVQVIPFKEFAKALMAGSGVDAAEYSGGRAMSREDIEKILVDQTFGQTDVDNFNYEDQRRFFDGLMSKIKNNEITSMKDVLDYTKAQGLSDDLSATLIDFIAKKIPVLK